MKLKLPGYELELVYSFRSNIYFERIAEHSVDFTNMKSEDLLTLFYSVVIASLQKAKQPIISMLDFMDVLDDNGGEKCLVDFTNWYIQTVSAQYENFKTDEAEPAKKKKTKKTN